MKIKIKTIISQGEKTSKAGKKYTLYSITTVDGKSGNGLGDGFRDVLPLDEVEVEIKESEYNGQKQLTFIMPSKGNNNFPKNDWGFEKRRTALDAALRHELQYTTVHSVEEILKDADKFLNWLSL